MTNLRFVALAMLASSLIMVPALVTAQDRMPPIPADKLTDAQKTAARDFEASRKTPIFGPFVPLLRSPDLVNRVQAVGDYLRYNSALTPPLSEFVILVTARLWTQPYEWSVHAPIALKAGVSPAIVNALADGRRPEEMSKQEGLLYDFCHELWQTHGVSDRTYAQMVTLLGERGVIDTVGIVGYYTMLGMVLNVARTPADSTGTDSLLPLPR